MNVFTELDIKVSNNEKAIIKFINEHPNKFIELTIQQLAKKLFISIGSISRLSKKLNFNSFQDLKYFVIKEHMRNETYYKLKKSEKTNSIVNNVQVYNRHTIEKTVDILKVVDIKKVIEYISTSSRVVTYGLGSSSLAANNLANNLNIQGNNAIFANTIHDVVVWLKKKIDKNIVIIIFSKGMMSRENIFLFNLLVKYKIKLVLVTENNKYRNKDNTIILNIKTLEKFNNEVQISSKISQLFISDVITHSLNKKKKLENTELYKDFHKNWKDK